MTPVEIKEHIDSLRHSIYWLKSTNDVPEEWFSGYMAALIDVAHVLELKSLYEKATEHSPLNYDSEGRYIEP